MTSDDPYTMAMRLCDDDGIVRSGAMHHGTDYPCTGHAHFDGHHIRCTTEVHECRAEVPAVAVRLGDTNLFLYGTQEATAWLAQERLRTEAEIAGLRAELELLRDLRDRVVGFGYDGHAVMAWEDAHRHHADEPYIGCPFCRDRFVVVDKAASE